MLPLASNTASTSLFLRLLGLAALLGVVVLVSLLLLAKSSTQQASVPEFPAAEPSSVIREVFLATYMRLRQGQLPELNTIKQQLADYPLTPYLDYQRLRNLLAYAQADPQQLQGFLAAQPASYMQQQLQNEWLEVLGQQRDWGQFLLVLNQFPQQLSPRLYCFRLKAEAELIGTGALWQQQALDFWRQNQPLPSNCQALTERLVAAAWLSVQDLHTATQQLLAQDASSALRLLQPFLSAADNSWLDFWWQAKAAPAQHLRSLLGSMAGSARKYDSNLKSAVLTNLLLQLAQQQSSQAQQLAARLYQQQHITVKGWQQVQESLALRAAARNNSQLALTLFNSLPLEQLSPDGQEWLARTYLRAADWPALLSVMAQFAPQLQQKNEWRYWQAQALQATQQQEAATNLLQVVAQERNYYGFLAARELGQDLQMNALLTPPNQQLRLQLQQNASVQRAKELYLLGFQAEAQNEWLHGVQQLSQSEQIQAALLALDWGWHHLGVTTAHQAGLNDALELRFPLAHLEALQALTTQLDLDLPLVLALIRKESLFNPSAKSSAGALGLMQVMPRTGQQIAHQLQLGVTQEADLLQPEHNLSIGTHYLSSLLRRYQGDPVLAAAAYNAGPARARAWQQSLGNETNPLWVERITFAETRDYVKSLLAFREVYAWRLQQELTR